MFFFKFILLCCALLTQNIYCHSQAINSSSTYSEKIYLQLDAQIYTTDQTIWFKSIVTNALDHSLSPLSQVLHVEIIDPNSQILEHKLIKLDNGIGEGHFELSKDYLDGIYKIRAYTEWNRNFGNDYFFHSYIHVFNHYKLLKKDPINNIFLIKENQKEVRLQANLDPFSIDSFHQKDLKVYLIMEGKLDSLLIKRSEKNNYILDISLSDSVPFLTIQIKTKNNFLYTKSIILKEKDLDLQFFPESGAMVHGFNSLVGFKAVDKFGKGKLVNGEIIDGHGTIINQFSSNSLGIGTFHIRQADYKIRYFARVHINSKVDTTLLFPLPNVEKEGNILSIKKSNDLIKIEPCSNYIMNDTIIVRISFRGSVLQDFKVKLQEGKTRFFIPSNHLPEGIIAFIFMDKGYQLLAERLFFNSQPEKRLNILANIDKKTYHQRELTKLNIQSTNYKGENVEANFSVLVMNKNQLGSIQSSRQNILTSTLLSSELIEEIENPGFYFTQGQTKDSDLDALLLTLGLSKYCYNKPFDKIIIPPQKGISVSGVVSSALFDRKKKGVRVTMMGTGPTSFALAQDTDSIGRFNFEIEGNVAENVDAIIQVEDKNGTNKDYNIDINRPQSPPVFYDYIKSLEEVDSTIQEIVKKNLERKSIEDAFRLTSETIVLDEVVVEDYKLTPERAKVMENYGKPDHVIDGDLIREKEEKWSYGLYSILMHNYEDKIKVEREPNGMLYAYVNKSQLTLVVIDGIPVKYYDYFSIPSIPPSEVKSFEIIENAKNFAQLFREFDPYANPAKAPSVGDVIAIYTYAGKGLHGAYKTKGLMQTSISGFSPPREFNAPKYEKIQPDDWLKPDLRALLHWQPILKTDELGKASTSFYNGDSEGEMMIVIEGISKTGEIGYHELLYNVKKGKNAL